METVDLLKRMQELGASFSISVPAPFGTQIFVCGPWDMIELIEDQAALHAKCYGVSKEEYLRCVEEEFCLRCAGITSKGNRCKNIVEDGTGILPKEWAERQGEYCHLHGGDTANF
ncbi:hypothetical protein L5L91_13225 [Shewanella sp. SM55]|uniref:hypothetical protein n=1 Tax=Shewanella sp. SM55 TaxID=2912800 RepID=UPI0021D890E3|nr:hypothetical protein [Shewanella sp. SM55]MCU8061699.1 hypothetical protein [Shewanella sp. SM55]